jgi:hypothetical protein
LIANSELFINWLATIMMNFIVGGNIRNNYYSLSVVSIMARWSIESPAMDFTFSFIVSALFNLY